MSQPWDTLAEELKDTFVEQAEAVTDRVTDSYKEFAKEIGAEYAKQAYLAKTAATPEKQAEARENLLYLNAAIGSRLASTQLDLASDGMAFLESVLKIAGKVALAAAVGL